MAEIFCDQLNKVCMHNNCDNCKDKDIPIVGEFEASMQVEYMQWVMEDTKGQTKDNTETTYKKTVKKKIDIRLDDLIYLF